MEKELLVNAIADIDFLLMLTGFALFMAIASLVIIVGVWEAVKDDRRKMILLNENLHDLSLKHNDLCDYINFKLVKQFNEMSASVTDISEKHNKLVAGVKNDFQLLDSIGSTAKLALTYVKESASMSNDAFNDINNRLNELEESFDLMFEEDEDEEEVGALS